MGIIVLNGHLEGKRPLCFKGNKAGQGKQQKHMTLVWLLSETGWFSESFINMRSKISVESGALSQNFNRNLSNKMCNFFEKIRVQ